MIQSHLVIRCEGRQGCPARHIGPPSAAYFDRRHERHDLEAEALSAGWHRVRRWYPLTRRNERWYCPDCRPDRAGGLGAPLPAGAIPADCPF